MQHVTRLRPGDLREAPGTDPHAGWCGEGERKTPPYPIVLFLKFKDVKGQTALEVMQVPSIVLLGL